MESIPYPQLTEEPPFCPNRACKHHIIPQSAAWWQPAGEYYTAAFGTVLRYRCLSCRKGFSVQTFRLDYYAKKVVDYGAIHHAHSESMSLRGMSRHFLLSCGTVQNRLDRLGRQLLGMHGILRLCLPRTEDVCIDGFQSFDLSQYHPNNYTISMTRSTRFALGCTHASLRRAGRMTDKQRERRAQIDTVHRYEKKAIERSFRQLLDQLNREYRHNGRQTLVIISDEHKAYARAFHKHQLFTRQSPEFRSVHHTVNSKLPRTFANPLFASNYIDREIRKDQAAHRRETACHCRNAANGVLRMWAYLGRHNYWKKFCIKAPIYDDRSHAEVAGIAKEYIEYCKGAVYEFRVFLSRLRLFPWEEDAWLKRIATPGKTKPEYVMKFAFG
jgi:hypothetical protein